MADRADQLSSGQSRQAPARSFMMTRVSGPRPLLLIVAELARCQRGSSIKRAANMAGSKYVAFVADMYGGGKIPAGPPEAAPLANALRADAPERRRRIAAALDTLRSESDKRKIGDLSARLQPASVLAAAMFLSSRAPAPTCRRSSACTAIF